MGKTSQSTLVKGQAFYQASKFDNAIKLVKKELKKTPRDVELLRLLSACYYQLKNYQKAMEASEEIVAIESRSTGDLHNLGHVYFLLKDYEKAEKVHLEGLALESDPIGLENLSMVYLKQKKDSEAETTLLSLINKYPQQAKANSYFYLGALFFKKGNFSQAIYYYLAGLLREPNNLTGLIDLANTAMKSGDHCLTLQVIEKLSVISLDKFNFSQLSNMAVVLFECGYFNEAIQYFEKALSLKNDDRLGASYAMTLLAAGNYEAGWKQYLCRIKLLEVGYDKHGFTKPLWQGEDLNGKTLLIAHEQGLGDNIQFLRFLPLLKQKYNTTVIFKTQTVLFSLLEKFPGIDRLITNTDTLPEHDYHLPLLSLPNYLEIYTQQQFMPEPYLTVPAALILKWQPLTETNKKLKIGIFWKGNKLHANNDRRNCQLSDFLFLCQYQQIFLVSLQKETTIEEQNLLQKNGIVNAGDQVTDMADTVAIMTQLDLIITIDTSVAHVAGAMGKKVWLLLPYQTEWRHPRGENKSPWYHDVSFIRQPSVKNWSFVFSLLEKNIQAYLQLNP